MKKVMSYLFADERKITQRILPAVLASLSFVVTFLLTAPLETFFANTMFFDYTVAEMLLPVLLSAGAGHVALFGFCMLLRGRVYNWCISLLTGLSVAGYVQTLFLNSSVGLLDGTEVHWEHMTTQGVLGLMLWIVIIAAVFVLCAVKIDWWRFGVIFLSVLICSMQVTNTLAVVLTSEIDQKSQIEYTRDGELVLSQKDNIIVLSVDSFDLKYADEVYSSNPEYYDEFEGFTWYRNTTPHYSRTFPSLAYIFTGEDYSYDVPYDEYMTKAWEDSTLFEDLSDAGYVSRVYAHGKYVNTDLEYMAKNCENVREVGRNVYSVELEKQMLRLSMYKTMPVLLKPFFETDTAQLNTAYALEGNIALSPNDARFYSRLTGTGLSLDENLGSKGAFTYYHLQGCHAPFSFDENCMPADHDDLDIGKAARGTLTNINEYLRQMKELGIYDSSTIIVTTDHGYTGVAQELERERAVALFYKPAGATGEMVINNDAPQQLSSIMATVLYTAGAQNDDFGTPIPLVEDDAQVTRYFHMSGASADGKVREENLITYEVTGDATDFGNWKKLDTKSIEYPFLND
ncbi:MAG: hypothetical protein IJV88_00920 [Ruminococcus sp.]|nr:hypothetical protein [Ruminococcus sp.]